MYKPLNTQDCKLCVCTVVITSDQLPLLKCMLGRGCIGHQKRTARIVYKGTCSI